MTGAANGTSAANGEDLKARLHRLSTRFPGHIHRYRGADAQRISLAVLATAAASIVVLGAAMSLARSRKQPRWSAKMHRLRRLERRLQELEDRGLRNAAAFRTHGLEKHAQRGLEKLTRHFGGYR